MFDAISALVSSMEMDGELRAARDPILNGDSCAM
jgi:hypothetical protein